MREITKLKLGTPFYDHFNGLEWIVNEQATTTVIVGKHQFKKGGIDFVSGTSRISKASRD